MPISLYFSNQVEQLTQRLAAQIDGQLISQDPLGPLEIIIPNTSLAKWLQLTLARQRRVAMNLHFHYLETGLWRMVAALDDNADGVEPLARHHMALRIMVILHTADFNQPVWSPIAPYLDNGGGTTASGYDLRLWQLSRRLAWLYREYEYHRGDMIDRWLQLPSPGDPLENCQSHVYRTAVVGNPPKAHQAIGMTLHRYTQKVLSRAVKAPPPKRVATIHCFGLSQLSAFHLKLLERLQRWYDIHIYTFNPCEAFWEDVPTPSRRHSLARSVTDSTLSEETEDLLQVGHPLLAAWGKSGRDHIRMLCQLTDYDFETDFRRPPADTVLHRLQRQLLTLNATGATTTPPQLYQDRSIQIVGCPGRMREVETVHESIVHNLDSNPHLKPTDVAVLVTQMEAYLPWLELVFNRTPQPFNYNLIDAQADTQSAYGRAIIDLLALSEDNFDRKAVFGLIQNPCLMQRFSVEADHLRIWADWVAALGIFHNYQTPQQLPSEPAGGSFSWLQGLRRLRLARIFTAVDPHRDHVANLVPYSDIHTADDALLQRFCQVVELLYEAARTLQTSARADWWQTTLTAFCERLFAIPPGYPGEGHVRDVLFEALADVAKVQHLGPHLPEADLTAAMVRAYLTDRLATISGGRGEYLTDGVSVAQLQPMRPIPFKIIYVLGLEEGLFPGRPESASLDLRGRPRLGETTLPESNRYLLLETLLSARQKLYLSFVNRDLEKDRLLQPCSPLIELKRHIETSILPPPHTFQIWQAPLSAQDSTRFSDPSEAGWRDTATRPSLGDHLAYYRSKGIWDSVRARLSNADRTRVASFIPEWHFSPSPTDQVMPAEKAQHVTLGDLWAFLWNPLVAAARRLLGRTDQMAALELFQNDTEEPFVTTNPFLWRLRQQALHEWIAAMIADAGPKSWRALLAESFDQHYTALQRQVVMPAGGFAHSDRREQLAHVSKVAEQASALVAKMAGAKHLFNQIILGHPDAVQGLCSVGEILHQPPLAFKTIGQTTEPLDIEIHAGWRWFWQTPDKRWHTLVPLFKPLAKCRPSGGLDAALFFIVAQAAEVFAEKNDDPRLTIHLVGQDSARTVNFMVSRRAALDYLEALLQAYFDTCQMPWLPLAAVFKAGSGLPHYIDHPPDDKERAAFNDDMADALEQSDDTLLQLIRPTPVADALERALTRLGIYKPFWE